MKESEFVAAVMTEVVKLDPKLAEGFNLEPDVTPGQIPPRVLDELCTGCRIAADYSTAFSDACKAQAEKHKIASGALKRYVKALCGDNLESVERETDDLSALIAGRAAT